VVEASRELLADFVVKSLTEFTLPKSKMKKMCIAGEIHFRFTAMYR
jgi:hypothetical protein